MQPKHSIDSCIVSLAELLDKYVTTNQPLENLGGLPSFASLLSALRVIRLSGEDANDFLQGQFSNDITTIAAGEQQLGSYCNPKGRALCVYRLLRQGDHFLLVIPEDLVDTISKRLQLYKMRANVAVELLESVALIGLVNKPMTHKLAAATECWQIDSRRNLLVAENDQIEQLVNDLNLPLTGYEGWQMADILSATAQVYAATSENFIPQQINLDLTGGISFTKGCYPGQEIVARIRYLGKLKQRLIIGISESGQSIAPGTPIFSFEKGESKAGQVVDAVDLGDRWLVSAMAPCSHICDGELTIGESNGPLLKRLQMPYEVTTER